MIVKVFAGHRPLTGYKFYAASESQVSGRFDKPSVSIVYGVLPVFMRP